ncbi:unnamed protein product [Tilletia caries]|nr:unnamed protein product [Tilletia caries]
MSSITLATERQRSYADKIIVKVPFPLLPCAALAARCASALSPGKWPFFHPAESSTRTASKSQGIIRGTRLGPVVTDAATEDQARRAREEQRAWFARRLRNRRRRRTEGEAQRSADADSSVVSSARIAVASGQAISARTLALAPRLDSGSERTIGGPCDQMGARIDAEAKGSSAYAQADHGSRLRYGARSDSLVVVHLNSFGEPGYGTGLVTQ